MAKWQLGSVVAFVVIFGLTALITGSVLFFIPALILAALVIAYALLNLALTRRVEARHDSLEDAMSDETEPLPSSHLIPDDSTPAGDTPEAHDEINPHDLPPDHPGRRAAEEQAGGEGPGEAGTTRGDADPPEAAGEGTGRFDRPRAERGG
jgi:HAMP domain-containing protein